ncbi:hypothetical protein K431DRAFT_217215 [Polychaeton citri CBS 116435]|uniref:Formin GTPase-binding domain-containing protein n=1 Tax=Polychaeton citri CBS 116435 TaxID=1314669 RepID=A0A9P4USA3_9PEZI|nr:hypothetical protein K431DRAFT_217215 [Polychaeton citri CBS 116435]
MSAIQSPIPHRPQHQRNKSSKSGILKSLVSPKSRPVSPDVSVERNTQGQDTWTRQVPLLPSDHPHVKGARPLGERHANAQSPPSSPTKTPKGRRHMTGSKPSGKSEKTEKMKKTKSATNLQSMFAKMNKSSKDLSKLGDEEKDKENSTPPASATSPAETPIWAQFSTSAVKTDVERPISRGERTRSIHEEIARYTPQEYSPGKQRDFQGGFERPQQPPTLHSRPESSSNMSGISRLGAIGRKVSGGRNSVDIRRSEDSGSTGSKVWNARLSIEKVVSSRRESFDRKVSGSSAEQAPPKEKLNITKRGGRVMAAVAAFQGKVVSRDVPIKAEPELNPADVDKAFEAVLDSRNIPEPMRQKMRTLTLRVKADFVKQDHGAKSAGASSEEAMVEAMTDASKTGAEAKEENTDVNDSKSTKRSRPRSRTFTFSKADKRGGDTSPSKKQRSSSKARKEEKTRPVSIHVPKSGGSKSSTPTTPTFGSFGRSGQAPASPSSFITYLKQNQDPTVVEVGRLHKLRILLRNETVAWVDNFISQGGMSEIVGLLHRIMEVEWREEHEDQLLHESLLCLKGLCTTERAMADLEKVADQLFPALVGMLFDDEKKGPAEYSTRTVIIQLLFNFLSAAKEPSASALEKRARTILSYLGEPQKAEDEQPLSFVLEMHAPRPYKLWCREVSNVTREVFWIFLHHLNVIPLPRPSSSSRANTAEEREVLAMTYTQRHFPGARPPVPAAPYIGGVEWDATTYLTAHLDLVNGLISSLATTRTRNELRGQLQASGFERIAGGTMRTCKEKFYGGVHDGLKSWVGAAAEDEWETKYVREGPTQEEQADQAKKFLSSPKKSPKKKEEPPQLEVPKLDLGLGAATHEFNDDDGWLG